MNPRFVCLISLGIPVAGGLMHASPASSQHPPGQQGSSNIRIVSHLPLPGPVFDVADIEIEQELSRPYAYVPRLQRYGFDIIDLKDVERPEVRYSWEIEDADLHQGTGALDGKYFKHRGRYYYVQSFQFRGSGPDVDLGAIAFDVTSLPDTTEIVEVRRFRMPASPGGIHNFFLYKHSDGRPLMFAALTRQPYASIFDLERFLAGEQGQGLVGRIPFPEPREPNASYHDFYAAYDPATRQDRLYVGGPDGGTMEGGNFVFDITDVGNPTLLASVVGVAGQVGGHTFVPSPDGRYVLINACCQYTLFRVFDLKPALDGESTTISRPLGAWAANWKAYPHNAEVRWPYVFVSAYEDGLQVLNLMDPTNPYAVGYYDTYDGPHEFGFRDFTTVYNGAFGIDVRNADGLIVISDMRTGFWAFRMDGFDGWNGRDWGMPNISSAQDWDNGPTGAPPPARVSARE